MAPWIFASRVSLVAINVCSLVFACLIIYYGSLGLVRGGHDTFDLCGNSTGTDECHQVPILQHPYSGLIALGAFILIFSLCGIAGACCAVRFKEETGASRYRRMSSRALIVYYTGVMLINSGLFYVALLCFLFADKANDYIDAYFSAIEPLVCGSSSNNCDRTALYNSFRNNSNAGGVLALLAIVVNFLSAHCAAVLMGYKYTMRKTMMISNFCGVVLGLVTAVVGFTPGTRHVGIDQGWLPPLIGCLGLFVMALCVLGFVGAFRLNPRVLLVHVWTTGVLVVLLFSFGVFCVADANDASNAIKGALPQIKNSIVDVCPQCSGNLTVVTDPLLQNFTDCCYKQAKLTVWNNLTVLGVSCIVTLLCVFVNMVGSFYLRRRVLRERAEAVASGEVDPVTGQPTAKSRQAARMDAYHAGEDPGLDDNL